MVVSRLHRLKGGGKKKSYGYQWTCSRNRALPYFWERRKGHGLKYLGHEAHWGLTARPKQITNRFADDGMVADGR